MMMMMMMMKGFRFSPTDEELIAGYLYPKVRGRPLPSDAIPEKVVYGDNAEPWNIFSEEEGNWSSSSTTTTKKSSTYVFTTLTPASANRISRRAGCGCWSGETSPRPIKTASGQIIGYKKMLTFKPDGVGHWIMHEYSLAGAAHPNHLVLCRITKCVKPKRPATAQHLQPTKKHRDSFIQTNNDLSISDFMDTDVEPSSSPVPPPSSEFHVVQSFPPPPPSSEFDRFVDCGSFLNPDSSAPGITIDEFVNSC